MSATTARFFDELHESGYHPLLTKARGVLRFDLTEGDEVETWLVEVERGDVKVSRRRGRRDVPDPRRRASSSTAWPKAGPMRWPR